MDSVRLQQSFAEENFKKFHEDVKNSMTCMIVGLDEKLNKTELKTFKELVAKLFDDFLNDLKILLYKVSQNELSAGTFKTLQNELNCIACDSKVSMMTKFPQLENSAIGFKTKLFKVEVPKKSSRAGRFCSGASQNFFKTPKIKNKLAPSFPQFPPSSKQCYIINKNNSIVKADPLKCLLNCK